MPRLSYRWEGEAPGRARVGAQGRKGTDVGCWGGSCVGCWAPSSPDLLSHRRGATHTLYGSRGSDVSVILKETLDLRKSGRELRSGSGIRIGEVAGKHLHGEAGMD